MQPAALDRAIETGRAPILKAIRERGGGADCAAMFPSVTPVCATAIATGVRQDEHHIPAMCWYDRKEGRYVDYGSSFASSRRIGFARQLKDLIYNMNGEHLPADTLTIFEQLDDAGVRTAGTTFLIYRGRHEHKPARDSPLSRLASTVIRRPVMGPQELFYADVFSSRETGCSSTLGLPGARDQHTGCVGSYLVERDLCDFLLFSLPDNDTHSHKNGPDAQVASIAEADRQLERLAHAAGGVERFLEDWAVIAVADHSHADIERTIALEDAIAARFTLLTPNGRRATEAEVAFCPSQRSAQLYALGEEGAAGSVVVPRLVETALGVEGVDLACFRAPDGDGVIARRGGGELRFAPGTSLEDPRGGLWRVQGDLDVLGATVEGERFDSPDYPDALARVWAALTCPTSGEVVLSAAPGWEFPDWGGVDHVGGGSHGSLHAVDSLGALVFSGVEVPAERLERGNWSIRDVAPMAVAHFVGPGGDLLP
ncbi:MAG: alkaline phosphatase family protein [Solirubrobacterales bacterium]|nr:alkaline phosphatase family protein [Solirubrobacterales bacterium]